MKKVFSLALTVLLLAAWTGSAVSMELGNKRKGKYTYRKVYKACYDRGEVESKTPFLSPADKTMGEWEKLYTDKNFTEFKCEEEFNSLSDKELLDIFSYLYAHGSDSPTPAKCK